MNFYQELQLNQAGSKSYIASFKNPKDKCKHIAVYLFKIALVVAFCVSFVTLFSVLFGNENSIAGVVVLLCVLSFRYSDLGIQNSQGTLGILFIYGILAFGPKLSNLAPTGLSFCINLICIFALALIGCHNITMFNHSTFVLSYLLLFGYDVSGKAYQMRLISLLIGAVLTASILYFKHRKVEYKRSFMDLFKEIHLSSSRTRWQICLSVGISSAMLIAALLNVPRVYWIGIAAMSVLIPFRKDVEYRTKHRVLGNILGSAIFFISYLILPEEIRPCLGIIGGIGTGFSASYVWQSAFNAFSAITVAVPTFGLAYAVLLRIFTNVFGSIYMWLFNRVFDPFLLFINQIFEKLNLKEANKSKAEVDMDIFLEKFISINGNMEKIFKEDREAYLIKISSDDILQMTRIDTASTGQRPLQCSDTFFDGKKSVLNTKECNNRIRRYLGPFTVQFTSAKNLGVVKMYYDPEEVDIQNVLQRIFENY